MRRLITGVLIALVALTGMAVADLSVKDGGGTTRTIFNFACFSTKLCNATSLINSAGTEIGTSGAPVRTDPTGTTTQPVNGTVTANIGTSASIATSTKQSDGTQKTQIVDGAGSVIASTSNNLNVQCANCSGSGVSTADAASFTASSSLFAGTGGFFQTTATNNALTNGQQGMLQMTANRAAFTNLRNASGAELGVAAAPLHVSLANTAANATAVKVDGSAVTQPVSAASLPLPAGAATSANQSTIITDLGTVTETAPGTDTASSGLNGRLQRIAQNLSTLNTTAGGAVAAGTNLIGKVGVDQTTPGTTNNVAISFGAAAVVDDPCRTVTPTSTPISITTATTTRIVAPVSAKKTYICYLFLTSAAADNVAIVEGTGGTCGTGTAGVVGGTTAANGLNFAANGGAAFGNGVAWLFSTAGTNVDLCLITSAATPLAGVVKWVQK